MDRMPVYNILYSNKTFIPEIKKQLNKKPNLVSFYHTLSLKSHIEKSQILK